MITFIGNIVHIDLQGVLIVLERDVFLEGLKRGKAARRAETQHAREARAQDAADRKREQTTR